MQTLIISFLKLLPQTISLIPYNISYRFVIVVAEMFQLKCWARNSYYHKRIIPGQSDIDFTVIQLKSTSAVQINLFLQTYQKLKWFIPFLGEINIYQEEMLPLTEKWINPYELRRDPNLKEIMQPPDEDQFYRFAYLLRMLESDIKNLQTHPHLRSKKWNYHFQETGITKLSEISLKIVIQSISQSHPLSYASEDIYNFLNSYIQDGAIQTYAHYRAKRAIRFYIVLFPYRWLVHANGINDIDICLNANEFDQQEVLLILAQIRWELVGIQTQIKSLKNEQSIGEYIVLMEDFLTKIKISGSRDNINELQEQLGLLKDSLKLQSA